MITGIERIIIDLYSKIGTFRDEDFKKIKLVIWIEGIVIRLTVYQITPLGTSGDITLTSLLISKSDNPFLQHIAGQCNLE